MNYIKILIFIFFIFSCTPKVEELKKTIIEKKTIDDKYPIYLVEEPYKIGDMIYKPVENYNYNETGVASIYSKSSHGKKTLNNEIINVSELTAAHKTLPLPSVVKVTNLKNNLSLVLRVNDRGPLNNNEIIKVSIQAAKLLNFYEMERTEVRIEILENESKQLKVVSQSISSDASLNTITPSPTDTVTIENIDEN